MPETPQDEPRRRRRAVGPAGARPTGAEPLLDEGDEPAGSAAGDEERLRAERPPHHDRER